MAFRVFGRPMDSWLSHMPCGMMLKSDGFASDISDPDSQFTLKRFCAEQQIKYSDTAVPVQLDTFVRYGMAFRDRFVPELDERLITSLERSPSGYLLTLDDGETVQARRVVLAVGITHFKYVPDNLAHLPPQFLSHSFDHHRLERFKGRNVVVIGAGSSAIDLAALLGEAGAHVQLVARDSSLKFHGKPAGKPRSLWQRIRSPQSGLGPGLRSRFYSDAPVLFHYLPEGYRLKTVRTHLGPSGGWFIKDRVIGKVPLLLGYETKRAEIRDDKVRLTLRATDGTERELTTDHVIAATGYKVDLARLPFLSEEIRSRLRAVEGIPILSSRFESSVPGLYFVGIAAANSFGPLMRFAYGGKFAARRIAQELAKNVSEVSTSVSVVRAAANVK